jgi:hypothetical protein
MRQSRSLFLLRAWQLVAQSQLPMALCSTPSRPLAPLLSRPHPLLFSPLLWAAVVVVVQVSEAEVEQEEQLKQLRHLQVAPILLLWVTGVPVQHQEMP